MATNIKLKNSVTTTAAPSSLVQGEAAVNVTDKKLWVGNAATTPVQLLGAGASMNLTSLTTSSDSSISGLTVGKGGGSVASATAVGYQALNATNTGVNNTALGYQAGYSNTSGARNLFVGYVVGYSNTTGTYNTFLSGTDAGGWSAGFSNTTGSSNTAIGGGALALNTTAGQNTAVGYQAIYSQTGSSGGPTTAVGYQALYNNSSGGTGGADNVAVGWKSLYANTSGSNNTALGDQALQANTTASNNTAVGYQAGYNNTTGTRNLFQGYQVAYYNTTGSDNVALGYGAGYSTNTGNNNTSVGSSALFSNTTASNNTAVGYQAGYSNTTGTNNTFLGHQSGYYITTGGKNTIVGRYDGNNGGLDIRTASNYIVLSDGDGNPRGIFTNDGTFVNGQTTTISGGITLTNVYGTSTYRTSNNANYGIHTFYSDFGATQSQRAYFSGNGGLANYSANNANLSDERMKKNINLAGNYLDKICAIPVKTFLYNDQQDEALNLGVIAQDVQAVAPELICTDGFGEVKAPDGSELLTVYETDLMYALMKSIQELKAEVDSLKQQLGK